MLKFSRLAAAVAAISVLSLPAVVSAQTVKHKTPPRKKPVVSAARATKAAPKHAAIPAKAGKMLVGTVSSVSGSVIALATADGTSYSIDASQAKLAEAALAPSLSVSSIRVGDKLIVTGTASGTSLAAKTIKDSSLMGRDIFVGNVTAVMGTIVSINLNGDQYKNYPVDAAQATVTKVGRKTPAAVSDIKVGDHLAVTGAMNASTITASAIQDSGKYYGRPVPQRKGSPKRK